jgi:hypothetical protein
MLELTVLTPNLLVFKRFSACLEIFSGKAFIENSVLRITWFSPLPGRAQVDQRVGKSFMVACLKKYSSVVCVYHFDRFDGFIRFCF